MRLFRRSGCGAELTADGVEFMSYARQVAGQADLLEEHWGGGAASGRATAPRRLSVSTQHFAFAVRAYSRSWSSGATRRATCV